MKYFYYPGCSLEGTGIEYNASTKAVMDALGAELTEIEDWTCCGASAAEAMSYLLSIVLPARNLALAEQISQEMDILVPCSACFLNLKRAEIHTDKDRALLDRVNRALSEEGLIYRRRAKARHLLDVFANDLGPERIGAHVKRKLTEVRVAPYYGCQSLRPYGSYDDPQEPRSMEPLIRALGADVHPWTMGAKCCGAGLMTSKKQVAAELTGAILAAAKGADCMVTVCPMCQMNQDGYQAYISRARGEDMRITILYLPQLIGLALGLAPEKLRLDMNLALTDSFRAKLGI